MGDKDAAAKVDLGLLEEDDEFEEFPADETETKGEDTTVNVWEDNWDDDKKEDDFANQLKAMEDAMSSRSGNRRGREREETPPPAKRQCTQSTPPSVHKPNGTPTNGHDASHSDLEALNGAREPRRSSRTSASSRGSVSSPPASPARRGSRRGGQTEAQPPLTPTRSSGRLRKN